MLKPLPDRVLWAMAEAVDAAESFRGATAPNPPVGCALLARDGTLLAVAAHRRAGTAHAEADAIAQCRDGGTVDHIDTMVVTLEPCNHWGRTPPCTEAILATPARTVVIGVPDPNPHVRGGGAERLSMAGLTVESLRDVPGSDADRLVARCSDLVAPFSKRTTTGRPWVTVKQALDASGSMVPPPGRKTFTSDAALRYAHGLRKRADAILTGSGTILADRPEFTVRRVPDHPGRTRQLAILDRRGRIPADLLAAKYRSFDAFVADDLLWALQRLGEAGALEVLAEAGPAVTRTVLEAGLWDEHVLISKGAGHNGTDRVEVRRHQGGTVQSFDLV